MSDLETTIDRLERVLRIETEAKNRAEDERDEAEATIDRLTERYNELLFQVAYKHPGESRHETALRYIRQAETNCNQASAAEGEQE